MFLNLKIFRTNLFFDRFYIKINTLFVKKFYNIFSIKIKKKYLHQKSKETNWTTNLPFVSCKLWKIFVLVSCNKFICLIKLKSNVLLSALELLLSKAFIRSVFVKLGILFWDSSNFRLAFDMLVLSLVSSLSSLVLVPVLLWSDDNKFGVEADGWGPAIGCWRPLKTNDK